MPYETVPSPNYPVPDYGSFAKTLGNLANTYRQGSEQNMQLDQQSAFKGGLPMTPQGQPDYAQILARLAQKGDIKDIPALGDLTQQQQWINQAGSGGGSSLFDGASIPPADAGSIPPASAASATRTVRAPSFSGSLSEAPLSEKPLTPPPPSSAPNNGPFGNVTGTSSAPSTLSQMVSGAIPDPGKSAMVAGLLGKGLKLDPNGQLTPEQSQRVQRVLVANGYSAAAAPSGGDGNGYAEPVKAGVAPPQNTAFADRIQDLQQDAGDEGVPSQMISGQRDAAEQAVLRARYEAGQGNVAAKPGQSLHESGQAADVVAYGPDGQQRLIDMAREPWRGLTPGADFNDPNHFQAAFGGGAPQQGAQPLAPPPNAQVAQAGGHPIVPQVPLPKGYTDPQQAILAIDKEISKLSVNPYAKGQVKALEDWRDRIAAATAPVSLGPTSELVDPRTGAIVAQGAYARGGAGMMSPEAINAAAENYYETGKLPPGMGRGMQGAQMMNAIMSRAAELHPDVNWAERPLAWQGFNAGSAGQGLLAKRTASLSLAENEAKSLIPRVHDASMAVSRTQYPTLNRVIEAAQTGTGDPNVIRLGVAVESLVQTYARVLSPAGAPTAADKANAHSILDKAWSTGQIDAALDQMSKEISSAKKSLATTRREMGAPALREESGSSDAPPVSKSSASKPVITNANGDRMTLSDDGKSWVPLK